MKPKEIYEDEFNLAILQEDKSDFLLVTFNHMGKPGRRSFWGQDAASKLGISCLGIVPKEAHWYPDNAMQRILPSLLAVASQYKEVITYGFSMGAYASLKYSKVLNASRVLAFSPQSSIDPSIVGNFDNRFLSFYNEKMHLGMKINKSDLVESPFIFLDQEFNEDLKQVELVELEKKTLKIHIPKAGHKTIDLVASTSKLSDMLEIARMEIPIAHIKLQDKLLEWSGHNVEKN